MYPPGYETGDEYESSCDKHGCGFATHHPACRHYTPPTPSNPPDQRDVQLGKSARCLRCGKVLSFREVEKNHGCCTRCAW